MARLRVLVALLSLYSVSAICSGIDQIRLLGPQAVNLWRLEAARKAAASSAPSALGSQEVLLVEQSFNDDYSWHELDVDDDTDDVDRGLEYKYPEHWFTQPLDHFLSENASEPRHTFRQRYWISTRNYRPGPRAPVIVLDGGETSGVDRLPFLDTGIVDILTRATGGVGVILEHRYYGMFLFRPVIRVRG